MALLKGPFEGISGVQLATGPHHRTRSVVGAFKWHPNSSWSLSKIYCSKRLVDNVTSQTSRLTLFITEEKSKNYLFKKKLFRLKWKLNHIISRGILAFKIWHLKTVSLRVRLDKHATHRFGVLLPFAGVGRIRIGKCLPVYRVMESLDASLTFIFSKYSPIISPANCCLKIWKLDPSYDF